MAEEVERYQLRCGRAARREGRLPPGTTVRVVGSLRLRRGTGAESPARGASACPLASGAGVTAAVAAS